MPDFAERNNVLRKTWEKFKAFLVVFVKGVLLALLLPLPWLMRLAAVLTWLTGAALAMEAIRKIYQPFTPSGAVFALQFAVIFLMVAWVGVALRFEGRLIWGGLTVGGLVPLLLVCYALPRFSAWQYAHLFSRLLPPALFALGLIYLTYRFRFLRKGVSHERNYSNHSD
jgi:hypothetical protein